ncbi:MAG: flagellar biosynthesis anti-sigma factor FlgM [SAR324 cluster bacterium]|nr:flagellar biosynthesis anti-sigma factor FlgM [SAR324 cluster bacterium]
MKITGQNPAVAKELTTGQTKGKETSLDKQAGKADNLAGQGSVKTSAFTLDKIKERIAAEPDVRADRVAELKAQIKDGQYKVDAQEIAQKMLTESLREDI